ncbi:MAG: hypothetical protein H8E72_03640 [Candidatus Marinimicrobia bacterium]|nr:hypothetical protein [Candidatus Neomarinimicrobiota bacterium]
MALLSQSITAIRNSFQKYKAMVKRRVGQTLLFVLFTFFGCDVNLPEKWEAPQWHLPLTMPLIDQIMGFEGILQGDVLTVDTTNNQIQIEFPGEMDPQGIPDSIFNISLGVEFEGEFSQEPVDLDSDGDGKIVDYSLPAQEINLADPLLSLVNGVEAVGINFTCFSPSLLNDPSFSDNLNQSIESTIETSSLISLGDSDESFFNLKSVKLSNGHFKLDIDNDLPFQITSLALVVMSGSETIWEVNAVDVDPYTLYNSQKLFSESPITISMTEDISYTFDIEISPEQAGDPANANWQESCFPDLDSPPVYLCDDILTPIDASSSPSTPSVYVADNTCANECTGECIPLFYCGTDGYVGVSSLSCEEYPFLGDFTSFTSPNLDPPVYAYISLSWNGSALSQSGFAYPMDATCANQDFTNDGVCGSPIPTCTSGLVGMPCTQDTDCNTQTECSKVSGTEKFCSETCEEGLYSDGWTYEAIDATTGDNGKLSISMKIMADEIGEVIVEISAGIQDVLSESIPSPEPISLPGFNGFNIKGVKVAEATAEYPNQLTMNMESDFIVPIDFVINMDNFFDDDGNSLTESVEISGNSVTTISVADHLIAKDSNESESFSDINISYDFSIEPGEYSITPVDNKLNMGGISYSAEMSDLKLAYISAIADSLDFAPSESTPIEGSPTGFEGFELFDIQMEIDLYNQIGIPVVLDFEIAGQKDGVAIPPVKLATNINAPSSLGDCLYEIGDTARTIISIDRNNQITNKYCGTDTTNLISSDTLNYDEEELSSFIDLMNYAPDQMEMNAGVWINGVGKLAPATKIWGTFEMIVPLAFIFRQDLTFMPEANMTTLEPFDRSTADQIDTALVSALLSVEIENSSPIGGDMALLISDSTYFPLYLDSLITGNSQYDSLLSVFNDSLETDIAYTQYEILETDDNKALRVDFFDADSSLQFWIGRLFNLEFEGPDSVDFNTGFVNPLYPKINLNSMEIDTVRMGWLTEDDTHYMVPMITFSSTNGTPRTFQTSNFLHMKSFITMTLASKGLLGGSSEEDDE